MNSTEIVIAIVIALGVLGTVIPVIPGSLLVGGAILVWATETHHRGAWWVVAAAAVCIAIGAAAKYLLPGRNLKRSGVPNSSLIGGGVLGLIGFFVVPVVGLVLGFVLGIYLAERRRVHSAAWPSTKEALKAVGLGIIIEFTAALTAALIWFSVVVFS